MNVLLRLVCWYIFWVNSSLGAHLRNDDKLIGVAVVYRHGDRAPISSYPNDPYHDVKYWPYGLGQLLDAGKVRQFELGKWLRKRYSSFLPDKYNHKDIYVRSSDVDRTLMSASSNLAGLYYPVDNSSNWEKSIAWEPIPIHTVPQVDDDIIAMSKTCPNFETLYNNTLYFDENLQKILKEHSGIKSVVEKRTGWTIDNLSHYEGLYTVFYVYMQHNASYLPEWKTEIDLEELAYLAGLSFSIETWTTELQRFKVGPFFNYLHSYFNGIISGDNPRFLMLSGHDGTLASILNAYGVYDYHPPEFAETVIWELYENVEGYYLRVFNKRESKFEELSVRNCDGCSYEEYLEVMEDVSVDPVTWKDLCFN